MKNNVIPRKFKKIIGRVKKDTSNQKVGDIFHIWKDEYDRYIHTDISTGKNYQANLWMLRCSDLVEFIEVIK